ncbi:MAG: hypothetical protein WEB57_08445 [Pseudohongiellaceae bacterium]
MRLTRLDIQQLPGIDPGFTVHGLRPGLNLVTGPNAVGKSSMIRALRYLVVEPLSQDPVALSLSAELVADDGIWTVTRTGRQVSWQHDGKPTGPPSLPDRDFLHCYLLKMEDLAVAGDSDRSLVEQLRQALTGGHDLRGLRELLFPLSPRAGIHERGELQGARTRLREVEADYARLQREEQELPELAEQIEAASKARQEATRLDAALTLHDVLVQRHQIESELVAFPAGMERLRGNELGQLQRLEENKGKLEGARKDTQQALEAARQRWRQTGLESERPLAVDLDGMRGLLDQVQRWHEQWQDLRSRLISAREEERQALESLGAEESDPASAPEQLDAAGQLADRLENNRLAREPIRGRLEDVQNPPDTEQIQSHWQGVDALSAWLSAREWRDSLRRGRYGLWPGIAGALAAAVLAILQQHWWAAAAAGIGVAGVAWAQLAQARDPATEARDRFRKQGLDEPEGWNGEAVSRHLAVLRREANRLQSLRERALSSQGDRERLLTLEKEAEDLQKEKTRLAASVGFDPGLAARGMRRFLDLFARHDRAQVERRALEAQIGEKERFMAGHRKEVLDFLKRWRLEVDDNLAVLAAALHELSERAGESEKAESDLKNAERELERIDGELSDREKEIENLYREAGLAPGDRASLQTGLERLDDWKALRGRLQKLEGQEIGPRGMLADHPEWLEAATSGDRDALQRQCDEARQQGERYDELMQRRSDLQARLDNAGADRRLEGALHRVDQAAAVYQDRLDEQLAAEAGRFLLEDIEREHQNEHEPAVLREARDLFGRFTHQAWDVRIDESGLLAHDRRKDRSRPLSELSSGTRMQLQLAVRMAWTRHLEQGRESLPLFLDEALTTSDESRFAAVAESLVALTRNEGRQVFYISARQQEPVLWEQMTGEAPHRIDLAALRFGTPEAQAQDYILPPLQPVPEPDGDAPEDYAARLAVPPVDPEQPPGDFHVFHLLRDDLPLLHRLMSDWRVTSLGQLKGLLQSDSAGAAVTDAEERQRLGARCQTARRWQDAWHHDRNRPVSRVTLQQSSAVSERFEEEIAERVQEVGGDPVELLAALRSGTRKVAGFGPTKVSALEEWLEQEGYVTPGTPLTREQRLQQVLRGLGERHDPADAGQLLEWLEAGLSRK